MEFPVPVYPIQSNPTLFVKAFKTTTVDQSALQSKQLNYHKYKTRKQDSIFSMVK